jgi:hypothetical protein
VRLGLVLIPYDFRRVGFDPPPNVDQRPGHEDESEGDQESRPSMIAGIGGRKADKGRSDEGSRARARKVD